MFDANAQRDDGRRNLTESVFAYLNRSAKSGSEASRALTEQSEFRARFRFGDNIRFATAFQQLFLHEFLRHQEWPPTP